MITSPQTRSANMNKLSNGTEYRINDNGLVAVRGQRTIHLIGSSVAKQQKAKELLTTVSFNKLFNKGQSAGISALKNTSYIIL